MAGNRIDMTEGRIFPKILKFSIPLIFSSVLQLLFNAADTIVVGRFAGDNSLAAVGSTSSLINLLINLFVGLSVGCNVVVANFSGSGEKEKINKTVHTSILLSFISGIILTLAGILLSRPILLLMCVPEEVLPLSCLYLQIFFAGITSSVVYNFGAAILRAKGDTKRPLFILLISGLINVVLNLIFVICFKMDVAGVSLATIISQTFSAVCVLILLSKEKDEFRFEFKKLKLNREILFKIIKIGVPAGIQGIIFSFSNVVIQSTVNSFGAICVAGNSAAQSIEGFVYISMNSIAQATLTFVGQNMGAQKLERVKKVVFQGIVLVSVIGLVLGIGVCLADDALISIYTKNSEVIASAKQRLVIICGTYFLCGIMDVMANSIRGMGYSFLPMIITLVGACGIRLLYLFTFFKISRFATFQNIFISYPVSWAITFFALSIVFKQIIKKVTKI